MKILQLVQKPQRRGAEIFAFQLSQSLRQFGHQVESIYLYPYTGENPLTVVDGDHILSGREAHPFEKLPGIHPTLLQQLITCIHEFEPEVVQVNGARTIKYSAFAKVFSSSKRWVIVYRNIDDPTYWVRDAWRRWYYRAIVMPQVDGVIGVSQATLHKVKTLYQLKAPMRFVPNGVDPIPLEQAPSRNAARQQFQISPNAKVLLFIGNLTQQKRPDRFLRMVHSLCEAIPALQAWFLGDGPLRAELEAETRRLGLQNHVRFWGYQKEIATYLTAADLLAVTSDSDGIPAVILEAAWLGVPVVATQVGGIAECVRDGETGLLVDPQEEAELVRKTRLLLEDPTIRNTMGQCAQRWAKDNFAIDKVAQQYINFYTEVLGMRRK